VFNELKNRGMEDCFVACVDGLKGLLEAIEAVYPHTQVQLCIVHTVRNALKYVPWKSRKAVAADLRAIYAAPTLEAAEQALENLAERWDDDRHGWRKFGQCRSNCPSSTQRSVQPGALIGNG
jgi:putative transposase